MNKLMMPETEKSEEDEEIGLTPAELDRRRQAEESARLSREHT